MTLSDWLQYGVVIPVAYIWHLVLTLRKDYNTFTRGVYTKEETKEMIQLTQKPMEQKLDMIHGDLHWIRKQMEKKDNE